MSRLVVPYRLTDGLLVVGDEAWLASDLVNAVRRCAVCEEEFVSISAIGNPVVGPKRPKYCSDECRAEEKRRRAREHLWPSRSRKAA